MTTPGFRKLIRMGGICLAVAAVLIQFVRPPQVNPASDPNGSFEAVTSPHPQTAATLRRACMDCHSNQTTWPWYSNIAPVSWLVSHDVMEGRERLNLSEWSFYGAERSRSRIAEMCVEVREEKMPPWQYTIIHGSARLSQQEVAGICGLGSVERSRVSVDR